jgi:excinuclease ABC subunit C
MISISIQTILKHLTAEPGIYRMIDAKGEVIYVGKATNLKKRVKSYFSSRQHSPKTKALVSQIHHIEVTVTRSEKEALLLECTLIKQLQPKYNILMRDDKSFPYIYIQQGHDFPRMKVVRLKHQPEKAYYFGPYPNASNVHATIHLLQSIFKIRDCQDTDYAHRTRPCLQYQIKRCSAPCVSLISHQDYQTSVKDALAFLQGKQQHIFQAFQHRMEDAVSRLAYEEAAIWRDKIKNLRMVQEQQAMISLKGELDVLVLSIEHGVAGIIRVVIREGKVLASETYFPKIPNIDWYGDSEEVWQELFSDFVTYYYSSHPQQIPPLILTSSPVRDNDMLVQMLADLSGHRCRIQVPTRGQKKDWLAFALHNLKQALQTQQSAYATIAKRYRALSEFLNIPDIHRMECFDISHTQGSSTVASCVVFDAQGPLKKDYRRFNIEGIQAGDDYAAMQQVLLRRSKFYLQQPQSRPQVVIIDGGKGQVGVAKQVLQQLMLEGMVVLGVSKGPSRKAGMEKLIIAHLNETITLPSEHPALHLLQHIRDEAHRFAITLHRQKRQKKLTESSLQTIPGIGRVRRKVLLQRFGGIRELTRASIDEIAKVPGISYDLAKKIFEHFHPD